MGGLISGIIPGGWQVMAALAALCALLFWLYTSALEDKGAFEQRAAQLEADVLSANRAAERLQAEMAKNDKLLAERERERAVAMREWAESEARYQRAIRTDKAAVAWGVVRAPDPALDFLCEAERDAARTGGDVTSFCVSRAHARARASGTAQ